MMLKRRVVLSSTLIWVLIGGLLLASAGRVRQRLSPASAQVVPREVLFFLRGAAGEQQLWVSNPSGADARLLLPHVLDYDVGPGGAEIVAVVEEGGASRLDIVDVTSGMTRTLVVGAELGVAEPRWSPADGIIAYHRLTRLTPRVFTSRLWMVRPAGDDLGPMLSLSQDGLRGLAWSPDGTRFVALHAETQETLIFNFTETVRRLPVAGALDWAPDGKRLVVSTLRKDARRMASRLVLVDLRTDEQTLLFEEQPGDDYLPRWAPDGVHIAFVRRESGAARGNIWVVAFGAAGAPGAATQVAAEPGLDQTDPRWSPDGRTLTWTSLQPGVAGAQPQVWRWNLDDGAPPALLLENASSARWP